MLHFLAACAPPPDEWVGQWRADVPFRVGIGELTLKNSARAMDLTLVNVEEEPRWFMFGHYSVLPRSGVLRGPGLSAVGMRVVEEANATGAVRLVQWRDDTNLVRLPAGAAVRLQSWDVWLDAPDADALSFTVAAVRSATIDGKTPLEDWFGVSVDSTVGARVANGERTLLFGYQTGRRDAAHMAALAAKDFDALTLDVEDRWLVRSDGWFVDVLRCDEAPDCFARDANGP